MNFIGLCGVLLIGVLCMLTIGVYLYMVASNVVRMVVVYRNGYDRKKYAPNWALLSRYTVHDVHAFTFIHLMGIIMSGMGVGTLQYFHQQAGTHQLVGFGTGVVFCVFMYGVWRIIKGCYYAVSNLWNDD